MKHDLKKWNILINFNESKLHIADSEALLIEYWISLRIISLFEGDITYSWHTVCVE